MILLCRKDPPSLNFADVSPQPASCKLLALPAELRTAIWEYTLLQPDVHATSSYATPALAAAAIAPNGSRSNGSRSISSNSSNNSSSSAAAASRQFCANVLRTCKQIHAEGTPILYGGNEFAAHPALLAALPSLVLRARPAPAALLPPVTSARAAARIRRFRIHVRLDTDPRFTAAQASAAFAGADALHVDVFQASYGTCDFAVLALFERVRGVGAARVAGSVGDGRYAAWLARAMMAAPDAAVPHFCEEFVGGDRAWDAWTNGNR